MFVKYEENEVLSVSTNYFDWRVSWFHSDRPGKCWSSIL